jgi:hypothetical protein
MTTTIDANQEGFFSAAATDSGGSTSEFSQALHLSR